MTHNIQSSVFQSLRGHRQYPGTFYSVVINTEEGESYEYEVEADSFAEAVSQAEQMANDLYQDITYVEVYTYDYLHEEDLL